MSNSIKTNTIFNILKTCAAIIFPLVTFPYISRILKPANVGRINFSNSFVSYYTLLAALGIATYAIRECAAVKNNKNKLSILASQFFSINLIATVIAYAALVITLIIFKRFDSYRTLIIIESTTILFTTLSADWLNSAMEDFKYITIRTIFFQLLALILMFIFVKEENDYLKYAIISVVSASGSSITNILYRKRYCKVRFTFSIDWKKHMPPIILLFVMSLSQTIFNNADITMLGLYCGDHEVGIYSTAYKVVRIISQVVQSVIYVVLPRLSLYFMQKDYDNANKLLRKILCFNISLGFPCVIGVIMMAKDIILVVGGSEYIDATNVIQILILSFLFSLIGGSFLGNAILIPTKQEKYYMIVCCITAVANIILNRVLIPDLGAIGASIATAFNGFLIMVLLFFKVDKNVHIESISKIFVGPIVGCLAIVICCKCCMAISNLWIRICVSVFMSILFYAIILIITKNDFAIEFVEKLKQKIKE